VALPISIPLIWGMFIRRAPGWAAWSAVLVGLSTSLLTNRLLTAAWASGFFGYSLNAREASDWATLAGSLMNILFGSSWFLLASFLAGPQPELERTRVEAFFTRMHTPVDFAREEGVGSDNLQDGHALPDLRGVHHDPSRDSKPAHRPARVCVLRFGDVRHRLDALACRHARQPCRSARRGDR
jgi:hypothetical protein